MELTNTFTVDLPVADAWRVLTDLERIAPCLPGAALTGRDGDDYLGTVKVKVGPVSAQYKGTARFVTRDESAHQAVIRAEGKDSGGQGTAAATITAALSGHGAGTRVDVRTELAISGRVAQFGRGVIADVTAKLLGQFVQRLEAEVLSGNRPAPVTAAEAEPVPLDMATVAGPLLRRALPVLTGVLGLVAGIVVGRLMRRSR